MLEGYTQVCTSSSSASNTTAICFSSMFFYHVINNDFPIDHDCEARAIRRELHDFTSKCTLPSFICWRPGKMTTSAGTGTLLTFLRKFFQVYPLACRVWCVLFVENLLPNHWVERGCTPASSAPQSNAAMKREWSECYYFVFMLVLFGFAFALFLWLFYAL